VRLNGSGVQKDTPQG